MPVYSSHLLQYRDLNLGARIREARQRKGFTLRDLAHKAATSSARLSQVENDRIRLSLEDVMQLAAALEISVEEITPPDAVLPYQITRDADLRPRLPQPTRFATAKGTVDSPHQYWPLANLFVGRHLEPVLGRLMPTDAHDRFFCYH